jgi:hypothetical protein
MNKIPIWVWVAGAIVLLLLLRRGSQPSLVALSGGPVSTPGVAFNELTAQVIPLAPTTGPSEASRSGWGHF